jgi:hypothetical protein
MSAREFGQMVRFPTAELMGREEENIYKKERQYLKEYFALQISYRIKL